MPSSMLSIPWLTTLSWSLIFIILGTIDLCTHRIPHRLTFPTLCLALGLTAPRGLSALGVSFLQIIVAAILVATLQTLGRYYFQREALGTGDIALTTLITAVIGLNGLLWAALFGLLSTTIGACLLISARSLTWQSSLPLGPGLACGATIVLFTERLAPYQHIPFLLMRYL